MNQLQATTPLEPQPETVANLREQIRAGEAVAALDPEGMKALFDAVAGVQRTQIRNLMNKPPTEHGAEYAHVTGYLKGLSEIEGIAERVVNRGKNAASKLQTAEHKENS